MTYGCIIGFEDDDDRSLSLLEEGGQLFLRGASRDQSESLLPDCTIFTHSLIPGTPQGRRFRETDLLRFEDPEIFGGIWVPCADTHHLSYDEVLNWQKRLLKIGDGEGKSQFMDKVFQH